MNLSFTPEDVRVFVDVFQGDGFGEELALKARP